MPLSPHQPRPPRRLLRHLAAAAAATLAALLLTACGSGPEPGASTATGGASRASNVPLTYLPAGSAGGRLSAPRLQATVRIGARLVNLLVDTGSTGLKVLASAVGDDATPTGTTGSSSFLSGLKISGREARATLRLGAATADNQTILLVDSLGCVDRATDCAAAHGGTPEEFGGVFDGILGIGMAERDEGVKGCCANPMSGLTGDGSFIVHFDEEHPQLRLNPPPGTVERFRTVSLKRTVTAPARPGATPTTLTSWNPTPMEACLTVTAVLDHECAPVVFDTGTPTLALEAPGPAGPALGALLPGGVVDTYGRQVALTITSADWNWTYQMPSREALTQPMNALSTPLLSYGRQTQAVIIAGLPAFTKVDVLYDLHGGRTGLAPR
ncbi:DUF3443 family protein [Streptomyces hesseae]|uniref:DUF3443 family protein n=1 Tax=Streptomyces hesseae TaxID=3075519 RepID=A0ABU2SKT2_9ACTN|nr:DUF3443 family protein [Streptomyces sp. DSM 40473]MDT0449591.1 DUF3443 family protein [Streptomyces sp. DSM 40473]